MNNINVFDEMTCKHYETTVGDVAEKMDNTELGYVSIVGAFGDHVRITGEVYKSNTIAGHFAVEVEFGTLYIDEEATVTVCERNLSLMMS